MCNCPSSVSRVSSFSLFCPLLSRTHCLTPAQKQGKSNTCQRAEHAREGSYKLILPALRRANGKKANISKWPSCQAQELLNSESCIPLSKRIPDSRQSPKHFHQKAQLAQKGTACHVHFGKAAHAFRAQSMLNHKIPLGVSSAQQEEKPANHRSLEHVLPGRQSTHDFPARQAPPSGCPALR